MIWLLSWLFPLAVLLPRARKLGAVMLQTVAGVGWQATIRPSASSGRTVNAWSAQAKTLGGALRGALEQAHAHPRFGFWPTTFAPKLGGEEFDRE